MKMRALHLQLRNKGRARATLAAAAMVASYVIVYLELRAREQLALCGERAR